MCTKYPQPCLQEIDELAKKEKSNVIAIIFLNYLIHILLIRIATVGFQRYTAISHHDFCMRTVTDVNRFPLNVRKFTPKFRTRTTEGNNPADYL